MPLSVVIMAAGQGKRMKSDLPKVLQPLAGRPLLGHVLDTAGGLAAAATYVVYGHGGEQVPTAFEGRDGRWVLQGEQDGTGLAVMQATPTIPDDHLVLILYGDVPLVQLDTLARLVAAAGEDAVSLLSVMPKNLCAKVPDGVSADDAAFVVLSAVALQGIRLAAPTLGETFAVIGMGLIGLITAQLLRANGCRVVGIDVDPFREEKARSCGAAVFTDSSSEDPVSAAMAATGGRGADGVLITASSRSSEPVSQAARMCRKRGRFVLVGVSGLELSRADFYEKELSFQVSCSYGPGRYDPEYEEKFRYIPRLYWLCLSIPKPYPLRFDY